MKHLPAGGRDRTSPARPVVAGCLLSVAALSTGLSARLVAKTGAPSPTVARETTAATRPSDGRASVSTRFALHILDESRGSLRLGYDFQPSSTLLKRAYPSRIAFTVTESGVETYVRLRADVFRSAAGPACGREQRRLAPPPVNYRVPSNRAGDVPSGVESRRRQ